MEEMDVAFRLVSRDSAWSTFRPGINHRDEPMEIIDGNRCHLVVGSSIKYNCQRNEKMGGKQGCRSVRFFGFFGVLMVSLNI